MIEFEKNLFVSDIISAKAALKNINWNFFEKSTFAPNELRPFNPRTYHWYPATFIPEIPFTLVEVLTTQGATVWDPFSGIGTTYFQALSLSRNALATEICKVAVDYMQSLFVLFNPKANLEKVGTDVLKALEDFNSTKNYVTNFHGNAIISRLAPWFSKRTLNEVCFLSAKEEENRQDKEAKAVFNICISGLLKTVCSQDRGWGCIADNVLPKEPQIKDKDVLGLFRRNVKRLTRDISQHLKSTLPSYSSLYEEISQKETIFREDVRDCRKVGDDTVDLVVTSPPYPNMTDYIKSQRLSYYFLGVDIAEKKNSEDVGHEIGARSGRSRKDSIDKYLEDMRRVNGVISKKLKKGSYLCYIMPVFSMDNENNKKRRQVIQRVLADTANHSLIKEDEYERILPVKRRSHNTKWATLEREKIHLFKKV